MWAAVELDDIPGRVRAVSAPDARQMLVVWTTEGLFGVWFSRAATILRMGSSDHAARAFDPARGILTHNGAAFRMYGECGPAGRRYECDLPATTPQGDQLAFDSTGRLTSVETTEGSEFPIPDPPRTAKWSAIGFSDDGRYLLVADEWGARLFRYTPAKGVRPTRRTVASGEQEAFLRAIHAEPDDDTPRLVYADWLSEHGDPARGELIRLQCQHARELRSGEFPSNQEREQQLLSQHGDVWQAELPVIRGLTWSGFWRGFPGVTVRTGTTLARDATAIWAAAPVESVVILKLDLRGAEALAKCPYLDRLRILEIRNYNPLRLALGCDPLRTLFNRDELAGLWWLAFLGNMRLGSEVAELIANSASLRYLEILTLRWSGIGDEGGLALASSPHLNKLRDLDLTGTEFTGDTPSALRKRFPGVRF